MVYLSSTNADDICPHCGSLERHTSVANTMTSRHVTRRCDNGHTWVRLYERKPGSATWRAVAPEAR